MLTAALLLGNASSLVPRFIPGADAQAFVTDQSARAVQGQMSFFVKSFFFVLIGLMFPTSPRLILLRRRPRAAPAGGAHPRRPARDPRPRSIEEAVLASDCRGPTGIGGGRPLGDPRALRHRRSRLPPAIFSLIVTSILVFCLGVALVGRMPDEADTSA